MTPKQTASNSHNDDDLLEELTDAEETPSPVSEAPRLAEEISAHDVKFRTEIAHVIKLYNNPNLAVMILDNNMTIIYSTPTTAQLFKNYYTITRKPFFNIFHRTLEQDNLRSLIISLKSFEAGYSWRVSYYCRKMSEYLYEIQKYPQLEPDFIENIGYLAAMHDVGKIGTPDYILQKPGKLTALEWEIMREHTINGTFILSSYPVPMAKEIALSHHEWWNGMGYPFKLDGDMIPLSARIVTIADVYDALRMKRSYKEEFTHEEAMQIIRNGSGTQFDPELIQVFETINEEFNSIWNLLKDNVPTSSADRDRSREFNESRKDDAREGFKVGI